MSIDTLLSRQNPDGGWPYTRGRSWTESTMYAILALLAAGESQASARGLRWIVAAQRPDGGWPPQTGVDESSWVTALVALAPPDQLGPAVHERAIAWLLATSGQESSLNHRLRQFLMGNSRPADQEFPGWPWVPGAASWVGPTSLAILALEKERARRPSAKIQQRLDSGRNFLLARMCQEGGWNHGSSRASGYEPRPYPETTGMALASLRGVKSPKVDRAIRTARGFLDGCRSADAWNWLRLGLLAHGPLPEASALATPVQCRTLPETSLALIVDGGRQGQSLFWS